MAFDVEHGLQTHSYHISRLEGKLRSRIRTAIIPTSDTGSEQVTFLLEKDDRRSSSI